MLSAAVKASDRVSPSPSAPVAGNASGTSRRSGAAAAAPESLACASSCSQQELFLHSNTYDHAHILFPFPPQRLSLDANALRESEASAQWGQHGGYGASSGPSAAFSDTDLPRGSVSGGGGGVSDGTRAAHQDQLGPLPPRSDAATAALRRSASPVRGAHLLKHRCGRRGTVLFMKDTSLSISLREQQQNMASLVLHMCPHDPGVEKCFPCNVNAAGGAAAAAGRGGAGAGAR